MSPATCLDRQTIQSLAEGRPVKEFEAVSQHLAKCGRCRRAIVATANGSQGPGDTVVMPRTEPSPSGGQSQKWLKGGTVALSLIMAAAIWRYGATASSSAPSAHAAGSTQNPAASNAAPVAPSAAPLGVQPGIAAPGAEAVSAAVLQPAASEAEPPPSATSGVWSTTATAPPGAAPTISVVRDPHAVQNPDFDPLAGASSASLVQQPEVQHAAVQQPSVQLYRGQLAGVQRASQQQPTARKPAARTSDRSGRRAAPAPDELDGLANDPSGRDDDYADNGTPSVNDTAADRRAKRVRRSIASDPDSRKPSTAVKNKSKRTGDEVDFGID